jgi:SulP family sulfate permease
MAPLSTGPHLYALRMEAELDFASANSLERAIMEHLPAQPINRIDTTGVKTFSQLHSTLIQCNITLHISGIKLPVEKH